MDLIKKIIRQVIQEYKYPSKKFRSGKGDFQKAGKQGFEDNGTLSFGDNPNYNFNQMVREIPGVKFPRQAVAINNTNDYDDIEYVNTDIADQIITHGDVCDNLYELYNGLSLGEANKIISKIFCHFV